MLLATSQDAVYIKKRGCTVWWMTWRAPRHLADPAARLEPVAMRLWLADRRRLTKSSFMDLLAAWRVECAASR